MTSIKIEPWMIAAAEEIRQCCLQQAGYLNAGLTAQIIANHAPQGSALRTPAMHRCGQCGHPADWHRADDSQNIPATSPDLKFRCIGYDCEAPGPPVRDGCDCPDFAERPISKGKRDV